ncbi:MAG: flavodoxin family protein [Desulfurococcaceae archaeon]
MSTVRILMVDASPRGYGGTSKLLDVAEAGVRDAGGEPIKVNLREHRIEPCWGCVSDDVGLCKFPCLRADDDFNKLAEEVLRSDGFIVATPVYWYSVPGPLKNFIDRMTSLENMIYHEGRSLLDGKVAGFVVVGADSGVMNVVSYLMVTFNSMGVLIPPWSMAYSHMADKPESDEQALRDAYNVGLIVTEACKVVRGRGPWYRPNVNVARLAKIASEREAKYSALRALRLGRFKELLGKQTSRQFS